MKWNFFDCIRRHLANPPADRILGKKEIFKSTKNNIVDFSILDICFLSTFLLGLRLFNLYLADPQDIFSTNLRKGFVLFFSQLS